MKLDISYREKNCNKHKHMKIKHEHMEIKQYVYK